MDTGRTRSFKHCTGKLCQSLGSANIPYCTSVSERVGKLLGKSGIRIMYQLAMKTGQMVRSVKDDLGLRVFIGYPATVHCFIYI